MFIKICHVVQQFFIGSCILESPHWVFHQHTHRYTDTWPFEHNLTLGNTHMQTRCTQALVCLYAHTERERDWMGTMLTKGCYWVSNQYLSPFTSAYLSVFISRTENRQVEEKSSGKVMEELLKGRKDKKSFESKTLDFNTWQLSINVRKHLHLCYWIYKKDSGNVEKMNISYSILEYIESIYIHI